MQENKEPLPWPGLFVVVRGLCEGFTQARGRVQACEPLATLPGPLPGPVWGQAFGHGSHG